MYNTYFKDFHYPRLKEVFCLHNYQAPLISPKTWMLHASASEIIFFIVSNSINLINGNREMATYV